MTWFRDLSDYEYRPAIRARNVGWLAEGHSFESGAVDAVVLERLWAICRVLVFETRGLHRCHLCQARSEHLVDNVSSRGETSMVLGSAEAWVVSSEGEVFAAPNLIYHYIAQHSYRPPDSFLVALSARNFDLNEHLETLSGRRVPWRLSTLLDSRTGVAIPGQTAQQHTVVGASESIGTRVYVAFELNVEAPTNLASEIADWMEEWIRAESESSRQPSFHGEFVGSPVYIHEGLTRVAFVFQPRAGSRVWGAVGRRLVRSVREKFPQVMSVTIRESEPERR